MNHQYNRSEDKPVNDQEFDHFFKSQLEHHEVTPDRSNWDKIKKWTFFGFRLNIFDRKIVQIAAALLLLLSATTLLFQFNSTQQHQPVAEVILETTISTILNPNTPKETQTTSPDFVLDLATPSKEVSDVKKEIIDQALDEYLAFLLEDENEFADEIDSLEILKYLEPVQQLPIDEMFAVIPDLPVQEEFTILAPLETKITIPHRFVEDGEQIKDLLLLYEINQLRK